MSGAASVSLVCFLVSLAGAIRFREEPGTRLIWWFSAIVWGLVAPADIVRDTGAMP